MRTSRRWLFLIAFAGGAAMAAAPLALAEPTPKKLDVSRVMPAASRGAPDIVITKTPADPPPMVEKRQWVFDLRFSHGDAYLVGVGEVTLGSPQATPRAMGRFAIELFEGPALIERVRFDFPMLGAGEVADAGVSLEKKLTTRIGVMFPATKRGTRCELLDRATNRRWTLPWPPKEPAR